MDTIFMSENSKTSGPHRLLITLSDEINNSDIRSDIYVAFTLAFNIMEKYIKII